VKLDSIELQEIVNRIVGPIHPIGETYNDDLRFENLKLLTGLVDRLLFDIGQVATDKDRTEHSMKRAGEFAHKFLTEIRDAAE
jgi:hypothetical protein